MEDCLTDDVEVGRLSDTRDGTDAGVGDLVGGDTVVVADGAAGVVEGAAGTVGIAATA